MDQSNRGIFSLLTDREVSQTKILHCPKVQKFLLGAALLRLDGLHHLSGRGVAGAGWGQGLVLHGDISGLTLLTYRTDLGRHQTVALLTLPLHSRELLSAEVEVGLVENSLRHLAAGGDGGGAVPQGSEGFLGRVGDTETLRNICYKLHHLIWFTLHTETCCSSCQSRGKSRGVRWNS